MRCIRFLIRSTAPLVLLWPCLFHLKVTNSMERPTKKVSRWHIVPEIGSPDRTLAMSHFALSPLRANPRRCQHRCSAPIHDRGGWHLRIFDIRVFKVNAQKIYKGACQTPLPLFHSARLLPLK